MSVRWSDEEIDGTYMDRSLFDFVQCCEAYIIIEQGKLPRDRALIDLLCDAIRLTRELTALQERHFGGRGEAGQAPLRDRREEG